MDQVQTSTLLHYRFWWFNRRLMEMHTQGDFLWLSFLWPRTNDTLWVNPCSPAPGIIRNYSRLSFVETSAQKQRNRSKVLPKNRFMSVVFNTRMSWWGSQHIDITVDVLLPTVCRPHDPREFRWKHHKYSTSVTRNLQIFPRKLGCANHGEKQILRIPLWESTNENRRPQSWPSLMNRITPR